MKRDDPKNFLARCRHKGMFDDPRINDAIAWASESFMDYVLHNQLDDEAIDEAAAHFTGEALTRFGLDPDRYTDDIITALFNLSSTLRNTMQAQESIIEDAHRLVSVLLEEVTNVELELNNVTVDSMPHVTWLLRAVGADPTSYLAKDVAHTKDLAVKAAQDKARLLGVNVTRTIDRVK